MQRGNFFYFIAHCCFLPNLKENQLCAPHTIFLSSLIFSKQWKIFTYLHFPSLISIIFLFTSIKYNLRASPTLVYNALYLHMWRAKMKIKCSSISLFNPSKTQSACTLFTNSSAELKIHLFKFFFFFFPCFHFAWFFSLSSFSTLPSLFVSFSFFALPLLTVATSIWAGCDGLRSYLSVMVEPWVWLWGCQSRPGCGGLQSCLGMVVEPWVWLWGCRWIKERGEKWGERKKSLNKIIKILF